MPVVAAAVCPHPPILVPQLAAGAASEVADLLVACDAAVEALLDVRADRVVVIGSGPDTSSIDPPHGGTFRPWGVDLPVGSPGVTDLPLSLLIGAWLLDRARVSDPAGSQPADQRGAGSANTGYQLVATDLPTADCRAIGEQLAAGADRVALLVMGDGSACRGEKAPGYADERAQPFDDAVAGALADGDATALLDLDPVLAEQLHVAGRAPWQVLAGAAQVQRTDASPQNQRIDASARNQRIGAVTPWQARLRYHAAPYGVTYLVASWWPA